MTDDSMIPYSGNLSDTEIARRVAHWSDQRAELATLITPEMDYSRLTWNLLTNIGDPDLLHRYMIEKECRVAHRLLDWFQSNPQSRAHLDTIQALPYMVMPDVNRTHHLRHNLWRLVKASQWISTRDASSPDSLLWKFTFVRLSAFLNTGHWHLDTQRLNA